MVKLTRRDVLTGLGGAAGALFISKGFSFLTRKKEYELGKYGPIEIISLEAERDNNGLYNPSVSEDGSAICYFESDPNISVRFGDGIRYNYDSSQVHVIESSGRKKKFVFNPPFGWEWDSKVTPTLTGRHLAVAMYQYSPIPQTLQGAARLAAALNDRRDGAGGIGIYDVVTGKIQRVIKLDHSERVETLKSSKDHLVASISIDDGTLGGLLEGRIWNFFKQQQPNEFCKNLDCFNNHSGDVVDVSQGYVAYIGEERLEGDHAEIKNVFVYDIARNQRHQVTQNSPQKYIDQGVADIKISKGIILYRDSPIKDRAPGPFLCQYKAKQIVEEAGAIKVTEFTENDPQQALAEWLTQGHEYYEGLDFTDSSSRDGPYVFTLDHFSKTIDLINPDGHHALKVPNTPSGFTRLVAADDEIRAVFSTRTYEEGEKDKAFVVQLKNS